MTDMPIVALAETADGDKFTFRQGDYFVWPEGADAPLRLTPEQYAEYKKANPPRGPVSVVTSVDSDTGTVTVGTERDYKRGRRLGERFAVTGQSDPRLSSAATRLYSLPPSTIGAADVVNAIEMGKAGHLGK
jgi:hypothetical protein